MEIEEVLRIEEEVYWQGVRFGVCGVLWVEFLLGIAIFFVVTLIRVWL